MTTRTVTTNCELFSVYLVIFLRNDDIQTKIILESKRIILLLIQRLRFLDDLINKAGHKL